jgi:hypothetical protein
MTNEREKTVRIEVNLRIPAVKQPRMANGYPINSADVRFIRSLDVPALPKPGVMLQLETKDGPRLECEVYRADWNDAIERFIVYCRYAKRSIPADEYNALFDDPDWEMRPLL